MYNPKIKYRWLLNNGLGLFEINPIYGESAEKEYRKEEKQQYFRETFSDKLTLVRDDFDKVNDANFDFDFELFLQRDSGSGFNTWWIGTFNKTDCEFDAINKTVEFKPDPKDKYRKLLSGMKKEYDLIRLGPTRNDIFYKKQPIIQVYIAGSAYVTNFLSGVYWEQRVDTPTTDFLQLTNDFFFGYKSPNPFPGFNGSTKSFIPGESGGNLVPDVSGDYSYDHYIHEDGEYRYYNLGSTFGFIHPTNRPEGEPDNLCNVAANTSPLDDFDDVFSIWRDSSGDDFEFVGVATDTVDNLDRLFWRSLNGDTLPSSGSMTHVSGATNTATFAYLNTNLPSGGLAFGRGGINHFNPPVPLAVRYVYLTESGIFLFDNPDEFEGSFKYYSLESNSTCRFVNPSFYCRYLSDLNTVNGSTTNNIPSIDLVPDPVNYSKVIGLEVENFIVYDGNDPNTGRFGRFDSDAAVFANDFFKELILPPSTGIGQTYPVNRSEWKDASFWWYFTTGIDLLFDQGLEDVKLRHAYHIHEVINILLNEIDSSITFQDDINHSEFLYSVINPVSNDPQPRLFLTPKSNVLRGGYDRPAERALIKLQDLMTALQNSYNIGWHVDDNSRLRIEHISWYENGGTYTGTNVGSDLTNLLNPKNQKNWSFGVNKYKYNKSEIPERIVHSWMDEVSEPFKGYPIQVNSKYAQLGNFDERPISIITTDIDYIQAQPATVSQDGFCLLGAFQNSEGQYVVPFLDVDLGPNREWKLQNGYLSMIYLQDKYFRHSLPASNVNINEYDTTATTVKRNKAQSLEYPSPIEPDPMQLVTTDLGTGEVNNLKINISTNEAKLEINHDTEQ